ncbi:hypothetical protein SK128_011162 [Halocaridina rubra]|uniref:Uncharacterized protein n=1 Tax=Halocaridina rubra TaxID=373956 RepID=A0AAN8X262_HALRR
MQGKLASRLNFMKTSKNSYSRYIFHDGPCLEAESFNDHLALNILLITSWIRVITCDNVKSINQQNHSSIIFIVGPVELKDCEDDLEINSLENIAQVSNHVSKRNCLGGVTKSGESKAQTVSRKESQPVVQFESSDEHGIKQNETTPVRSERNDDYIRVGLSFDELEIHQIPIQNGNIDKLNSTENDISYQRAVAVVQSYVDDIIQRTDRDKPSFIFINPPNPVIMKRLYSTLKQIYRSSFVIDEPMILQNYLNNSSAAKNRSTIPTQATPAPLPMPLFPFHSYFETNLTGYSSTMYPNRESDYIKQELSSIADISVSSGKLINDTIGVLFHTRLQNFPSDEDIKYINNTLEASHCDNSTDCLYGVEQISSGNLHSSQKYLNEDDQEGAEKTYSTQISQAHVVNHENLFEVNDKINSLLIDNIKIPDYITEAYSQMPLIDILANYKNSTNLTKTSNNNENFYKLIYNINDHHLPYSSLTTAGNEDYNEEIDGEFILSPSKFLRKGGPIRSVENGSYENYEHGYDKNLTSIQYQNITFREGNSLNSHLVLNGNGEAIVTEDYISSTEHIKHSASENTFETYNDTKRKVQFYYMGNQFANMNHDVISNIAQKGQPTSNSSNQGQKFPGSLYDKLTEESHTQQAKHEDFHHQMSNNPLNSVQQEIITYMTKLNHTDQKILGFIKELRSISEQSNNTKQVGTSLDLAESSNSYAGNYSRNSGKQISDHTHDEHPESAVLISNSVQNLEGSHSQSDTLRQQIPQNYFPSRTSSSTRPSVGHHHRIGNQNNHISAEQERIISRLPAGMQQVVTSIVQALQVPTQTTTTTPPFLHPYPYPSPHYLAHFNPLPSLQVPISHTNAFPHITNDNQHYQELHINRRQHDQNTYNIQDHHGNHSHTLHNNNGKNKILSASLDQQNGKSETESQFSSNNNISTIYNTQNYHASVTAWTNNPILTTTTLKYNGDVSGEKILPVINTNEQLQMSEVIPFIGQSRLGVTEKSVVSNIENENRPEYYNGNFRENQNQHPVFGKTCQNSGGSCENRHHNSNQSIPFNREQDLFQQKQTESHMGNRDQIDKGIAKYRPQINNMQMNSPVLNVVLPETTSKGLSSEEEGSFIDSNLVSEASQELTTKATSVRDREDVNSLLHSFFSSPTLLLLGIIFATSAAYLAIAIEEQAAQQRFQQAQLAAAFAGQPFPPGRKRRDISFQFESKIKQKLN